MYFGIQFRIRNHNNYKLQKIEFIKIASNATIITA